METIKDKALKRGVGIAGLVATIGLMLFINNNMAIILNPNWFGNVFTLFALYMLFHPWVKLFLSWTFLQARTKYFGLYIADNTFFRILSVFLTFSNIGTILYFVINSLTDANVVAKYEYTIEDGNSSLDEEYFLLYFDYVLMTIAFWGFINVMYTCYMLYKRR